MAVSRVLFPRRPQPPVPAPRLPPKPTSSWIPISRRIHKGITTLYQEDVCTDFEIVTDSKSFRCHKVVLAATSDYFKAMFSSGMKETELNQATFTDVKAQTFETLFSLLYCEDYDTDPLKSKSDKEMADVYDLSVRLQISFLERLCEEYFQCTTNSSNCIDRWKLGKTFLCEEVQIAEFAWNYITKNFAQLENDELLLSLDVDEFRLLLENKSLDVPNENIVWKLIRRWIIVSEDRKVHLETLIKECCLTQIDHDFLVEELVFDPLVRENEAVLKIVQEAVKFKNHPSSHGNLELRFRSHHRKDQSTVMLYRTCEVWPKDVERNDGTTSSLKLSAYDRSTDGWLQWPSLDKLGQYTACCVHGDSLFVLTGFHFAYKRAALFEFNGNKKKWISLREMPAPLVGHTMSATNGCIFILGGRSHNHQNYRVYQYTLGRVGDPWRQPGEMMASVMYPSSVSHGNKIYIFGGEISGSAADCIQVYDTETHNGTIYGNLPKPCRWSRVLCRTSFVHLVSMEGDVVKISLEDGSSNVIATIPKFHRTNFGISLRDGELFVYGGRKMEAVLVALGDLETSLCGEHKELADDVFVVDISNGDIAKSEALPEPRDVVCCADLVHSV